MIVGGQWLASLTVYGSTFRSDADAWRVPLICQIIPPGIVFLAAGTILPESPTWFLIKDRRDEARKAFQRFNGLHFDADPPLITPWQPLWSRRRMQVEITLGSSASSSPIYEGQQSLS